tara:strand:+ start:953 stop:1744 length:792 start_codon:yes stop_codon:yes gene_type:complete
MGIVEPFARRVLSSTGGKAPSATKVQKFAQATMEMIFYGAFAIAGAVIIYSQVRPPARRKRDASPRSRLVPPVFGAFLCGRPPLTRPPPSLAQEWAWPSALWWDGMPSGSHLSMRDDCRCFYLLYIARYFQGFVSVCLEHKRKDFIEMQLHHSTTFVLTALSYAYGFNRVGLVVMAIFDPADVPLHAAKQCKYIGEARSSGGAPATNWWLFSADRLFELFAVTFFVTRLGLHPYVCWSAHVETDKYFPKGLPEWSCVALLEVL